MTSEEEDLANLFLVLKGNKKKREDWISIAKRCDKLVRKSNSTKKTAEDLGVSYQLLRSILSILKLPTEVQKLVKSGKILSDAAYRINTIKDPSRQKEVAKIIADLKSHEQREIIQYAKKFPNAKLSDFKNRVIKPRDVEKLHIIIVPLDEKTFNAVNMARKKKKITLEKALVSIVEQWVGEQK